MMYTWHQQVKEAAVENLQRPGGKWKERKRLQPWLHANSRFKLGVFGSNISFLHLNVSQSCDESSMMR